MELSKNWQNLNDGLTDLDYLYAQLLSMLDDVDEGERVPPTTPSSSLRQEQDDAYQRSLAADRLKKQRTTAEEQLIKRRVVKVDREALQSCLPEAPVEGGISLSILLPNNRRVQRRWLPQEHTVTQLYDWVYCEWSECEDRHGFVIRQPLGGSESLIREQTKRSLAEAGLTVSAKLVVEIP